MLDVGFCRWLIEQENISRLDFENDCAKILSAVSLAPIPDLWKSFMVRDETRTMEPEAGTTPPNICRGEWERAGTSVGLWEHSRPSTIPLLSKYSPILYFLMSQEDFPIEFVLESIEAVMSEKQPKVL